MTEAFKNLPSSATIQPTPFKVDIPQQALDELKLLLKYSRVAADTYESVQDDFKFGIITKWIQNAKEKWENEFDWRKHEARINSFPQYTAEIIDDDQTAYKIHFAALYSDKPNAAPVMFIHGWPGSFLEFLPILDILRTCVSCHCAFADLMIGLGFGAGYVAQGGDIGSRVARMLGSAYSNFCKAVHLNLCPIGKPANVDDSSLTEQEQAGIKGFYAFLASGCAYGLMHATRTSTIGTC